MGKGLAGTALGFAIGGLVLGWFPFLGWLIWLAGLVLAIIALIKCKTPAEGRGMAIAAAIIMAFSVVFGVLFIMIGSMAYFGVVSSENLLPSSCVLSGGFSCMEHRVASDGVRTDITNNLGITAESVEVSITGGCEDTMSVGSLENGETVALSLCEGQDLPEGAFRGELAITYQKVGEEFSHTALGSISDRVE